MNGKERPPASFNRTPTEFKHTLYLKTLLKKQSKAVVGNGLSNQTGKKRTFSPHSFSSRPPKTRLQNKIKVFLILPIIEALFLIGWILYAVGGR